MVSNIATVLIAGDSGDGIQLVGQQLATANAFYGNSVRTYPDFPAEIRAPIGTLAGVSAFQLCFGDQKVYTAGDEVDVLVAFNPAAIKMCASKVKRGGLIIYDEDKFSAKDLNKADYISNPLEDGSLGNYRLLGIKIAKITTDCLREQNFDLPFSKIKRCKNFFTLGLLFWLYDRSPASTLEWLKTKFKNEVELFKANSLAITTGINFAETAELMAENYNNIAALKREPGFYRQVTGNEACALACMVATELSGKKVFASGYPITPASGILHFLSKEPKLVSLFQAEDEIASICSAIGAAFGGSLALTITSGPGFDLKSEAMGLAVAAQIPLVILNVQRAGPSTGMPTKGEQTDLNSAIYGRHGEAPIPVFAAKSPVDCFYILLEAFRVAVKFMTPVIVLSDAWLANGSEAFPIPDLTKLEKINLPPLKTQSQADIPAWIIPGEEAKMFRTGGLERDKVTNNISYDGANHALQIEYRDNKVASIVSEYQKIEQYGNEDSDICIVTWGSSFGSTRAAVLELIKEGYKLKHFQVRYLFPIENEFLENLKRYKKIIVAEHNKGQYASLLETKILRPVIKLNKVTGQAFLISELRAQIKKRVEHD